MRPIPRLAVAILAAGTLCAACENSAGSPSITKDPCGNGSPSTAGACATLSGRVMCPRGLPVPNARILVSPTTPTEQGYYYSPPTFADTDGWYAVTLSQLWWAGDVEAPNQVSMEVKAQFFTPSDSVLVVADSVAALVTFHPVGTPPAEARADLLVGVAAPPGCSDPAELYSAFDPRIYEHFPRAITYVVVFHWSVESQPEANRLADLYGFEVRVTFEAAIKAFAANLSPWTVAALRCEPAVDYIEFEFLMSGDP